MSAEPHDPCVSGPWQQVACADCHREYQCTPSDDHYLPTGEPDGSPRVCFGCLLARNNLELAAEGNCD